MMSREIARDFLEDSGAAGEHFVQRFLECVVFSANSRPICSTYSS